MKKDHNALQWIRQQQQHGKTTSHVGRGEADERGLVRRVMPRDMRAMPAELSVPDVFDEARIRQDLADVARGGFFRQYVARLRTRFTKSGELAVMDRWIRFYETGIELVEAKTTFDRKAIENRQLGFDHEVNTRKQDAEVAKWDADKEEHLLRKEKASYQRQHIEEFVERGAAGEDERQMNAAHERLKKDSRWKIYETLDTKLTTLAELQRWRKQQRADIVRDRSITPEEQEERLEYIDALYDAQRAELKTDSDIFKDE